MSSSTPIFRIATRGDDFVGITMDNGSISVCLPLGAKYPQTERHQKQTARNLIRVLREFRPSENSILGKMQGTPEDASKAFPFDACITLILDFLDTGEILSTELIESKISGKGKIDWRKTFRKSVPYGLENGEFLYTQFITRNSSRNLDADISKVHRRCLDFAFENVGWLVTDVEYRSNDYALSDIFAESVVRTESQRTFNDRKRKLLSAMTDILMSLQAGEKAEFFTFGTRHFEFVWEGMIDRVFGAPGKKDYFPRANWILASGNRTPAPLEIDSIM